MEERTDVGRVSAAIVIGLVGGVGVGKSSVTEILEREHGARVIRADEVGHELMKKGEALYRAEVAHFGEAILGDDGEIDRKKLGAIVFADPAKLAELNALAHPAIREEIARRVSDFRTRGCCILVVEAALPEEAGLTEICDQIWAVTAPCEVRIERLMASRGYTREKCLDIMANQKSEAAFSRMAAVVIDNGGSREDTARQIREALIRKRRSRTI